MLTEWRYSMKLNLGNQIRINRRRMNLTQEQLAEKFGTSPQAISRWEIGATYPDIEMLPIFRWRVWIELWSTAIRFYHSVIEFHAS